MIKKFREHYENSTSKNDDFHKVYNSGMTKEEIDFLCNEYDIKKYTISNDGYVNVDGNVDLINKDMFEIPVKFGKINGNFSVADNQLLSLENSPYEVTGDFDCSSSSLMSLEGSPVHIHGNFHCFGNNLTSFEGAPDRVDGEFDADDNQIFNLKGFTLQLNGYLHMGKNPLYPIISFFGPLAKNVVTYLVKNGIYLDRGIIKEEDFIKALIHFKNTSKYDPNIEDKVQNLKIINKKFAPQQRSSLQRDYFNRKRGYSYPNHEIDDDDLSSDITIF